MDAHEDPALGTTPSASETHPVELDPGVLRDILRGAVMGAGEQAHAIFARAKDEREAGLWLTEKKDQRAIGDPLARIFERRADITAPSPDLADLLLSLAALGAYLVKHARTKLDLRRSRRALAALDLVEPPDAGA